MKSLKKNILKITASIAGLYLLNSFFIPTGILFVGYEDVNNKSIQEVTRTKRYIYNYSGTDEERARKYLKLAHLITMKHIDMGIINYSDHSKGLEHVLSLKKGDCSETSLYIYSNYLFFIRATGNHELARYVRGALGKDKNTGIGHQWLELKRMNAWIPYETTAMYVPKNVTIGQNDIGNIDENIPDKLVLNNQHISYYTLNTVQILPDGSRTARVDFLNALKDYQGFMGEFLSGTIKYGLGK